MTLVSTTAGRVPESADDLASPSDGDGDGDGDLCQAYCATLVECASDPPSLTQCLGSCYSQLSTAMGISLTCEDAWENLCTCVSELDCTDYEAYECGCTQCYPCFAVELAISPSCQ